VNLIREHLFTISGVFVGASVGFLYHYFVGCSSNSCAIASSPTISTMYGAALGYLLVGSFNTNHKN
jgi:F0F1-type ATP synthase assembly protein I